MLGLRASGMMHYGPCLELLGFRPPLLASSTEFSGSDFEVLLWFQLPRTSFGELMCNLAFTFSACQKFTGHYKGNFFVMARSTSAALGEVGKRRLVRVHVS